jgi:hypothetical protein
LIPLSELTGYANGSYQIRVRAQDSAGTWGLYGTVFLTVQRGIFSDAFEATPLVRPGGWGGVTGTASVSTTAAITGSSGLLVTSPGPSYVTDFNPNNESVYSARFLFNPNTLVTGAGTNSNVSIFAALTGSSGNVVQIQYHRVNTNAGSARQVRLVVTRSNATTASTAWITIPAGPSSLQVDWRSATSATVTLKVNSAATSLTGQNTSTLRVESARLGLVSTGATGGSAFFDAFQSDRTILP